MKKTALIISAATALLTIAACNNTSAQNNKKNKNAMEQLISMNEALHQRQSTRAYDMAGLTAEELKQITDYANSV
ncbi:MAG: hypothetical protein LKK12_02540 [Bacteroidales bacterium]|jgi:hypothetical protein|nr:hypothetical protein [Bacteroidales bacterium]MCI2133244.1 hypothetical protein [Bacteroidales bacterium]